MIASGQIHHKSAQSVRAIKRNLDESSERSDGTNSVQLIDLQDEICLTILGFVGVSRGWQNLGQTCRQLYQLCSSENACRYMAELSFPRRTLRVNHPDYHGSWRNLLMDGNARNGVWVQSPQQHPHQASITAVGFWKRNNEHNMYYVNSAVRMVWNRSAGLVCLILDAYGEDDLRTAHTTRVYRKTASRSTSIPCRFFEYQIRAMGHQRCLLAFPESEFLPNHTYTYLYNGTFNDYETATFLILDEKGLKGFFLPYNIYPRPQDSGFYQFWEVWDNIPDVTMWPGVFLPKRVVRARAQGNWGSEEKDHDIFAEWVGEEH